MKLNGKLLKKLIFEVIEEAKQERRWIQQQPEGERASWLEAEKLGIKLSDLAWIRARRGELGIEEVAKLVANFREDSIQKKIKNIGYDTNLSQKDKKHTVEYLRRILNHVEGAKEFETDQGGGIKNSKNVRYLGKVGKWEILLPITRSGSISCDISGKDTNWCTQYRQGQNLFYSYLETPLFYIMDYTRTPDLGRGRDLDARLSVGFSKDGKPILGLGNGSISVDASNTGLTEDRLRQILGSDYETIINIASSEVKRFKGIHPAKEQMRKASKNPFIFRNITANYKKEEMLDFVKKVFSKNVVSTEVLQYLSRNKNEDVRLEVAKHGDTPPEVLLRLSKDTSPSIKDGVARHPNSPPEALLILSKENDPSLRSHIESHPNATPEILEIVKKQKEELARLTAIAKDASTTAEVLNRLVKNRHLQRIISKNKNAPSEALTYIATSGTGLSKLGVARHHNSPPEALRILADSERERVRINVAKNPNTPIETLKLLAKDHSEAVARAAKYSLSERTTTSPFQNIQESRKFKIKILK